MWVLALAAGTLTQSLTATGIETATITNTEISTTNSARTVGVTGATLLRPRLTVLVLVLLPS